MAGETVKQLTPRGIISECGKLQSYWDTRNKKMKDWYDILTLNDEFKENDMESFVTNDPRTFYNMSMHLLCDKIPHRIPFDDVEQATINQSSLVETVIDRAWKSIDKNYRERGKQNFLHNFVGLMLATGWYSVFATVDQNGFNAETWSPIEVFPEWDETQLVKVARIYKLTKEAAQRYVSNPALPIKYTKPIQADIMLYNYWFVNDTGQVCNALVLGDDFIKGITVENFTRIPVFVSPVSGLPDTGLIKTDESWKEHYGESIFATNEGVYRSYNKQWTFSSQLLRDTAQPRWFERSATGDILKPADLFKRGAVFKGGLQDSIEPLPMPAMPIELRTDRYDIQGMLQRGSLPWSMSGDIKGDMSGYLMAQVASSAQETLAPYHDAIKNCLGDIDNFWLAEIMAHNLNPFQVKNFKVLPEFHMTADYALKIPGDLVQRATVAKMLNPQYVMSTSTLMDFLFPEIKNPVKEQALARKDQAMNSPMSIQISTITAYRQISIDLKAAGDHIQSALFDKAANFLEQQLFPQQQQSAPAQGPSPMDQLASYGKQPSQTAMPRQAMQNPASGLQQQGV